MRTPDEAVADVAARLRRTWSHVVAGEDWAPAFRLRTSSLTAGRLAESWAEIHPLSLHWSAWSSSVPAGVRLEWRPVTVYGTQQSLPATLLVDTVETAAAMVGAEWPARVQRARDRRSVLAERFPALDDVAAVLRATDAYDDVDFGLLCRVAEWFALPHSPGLTARQVPVEGLGTKWLGARDALVMRLAGVATLGLQPGRPPRVHLTYLDPTHLARGGRRHDLATVGDVDAVAYPPQVVVISENRDTAQLFPPITGGIAIEGEGRGARAVAALPWVRDAEALWYWGDMDADGLEILNEFRAAGLPVRSLFMDLASYERWARYGVDHDHGGAPLRPRTRRAVELLEPAEHALYTALCSDGWSRHRRIEQERIPLDEALRVIAAG